MRGPFRLLVALVYFLILARANAQPFSFCWTDQNTAPAPRLYRVYQSTEGAPFTVAGETTNTCWTIPNLPALSQTWVVDGVYGNMETGWLKLVYVYLAMPQPVMTVTNAVPAPTPTARNYVVNGDFRSGLANWSIGGPPAVVDLELPSPWITNCVTFGQGNLVGVGGSISQMIALAPGQKYQLGFDVTFHSPLKGLVQSLTATVVGTASLASLVVPVTSDGTSGSGSWAHSQVTFVADSSTVALRFKDTSLSTANIDLLLRNVQLIATP